MPDRADAWLRKNLVLILGLLVLVYTFVPIFVVVLMSFNDPDSRVIYQFDGFTLHNWLNPCETRGHVRGAQASASRSACSRPSARPSSAPWRRSRWCATTSWAGRAPTC